MTFLRDESYVSPKVMRTETLEWAEERASWRERSLCPSNDQLCLETEEIVFLLVTDSPAGPMTSQSKDCFSSRQRVVAMWLSTRQKDVCRSDKCKFQIKSLKEGSVFIFLSLSYPAAWDMDVEVSLHRPQSWETTRQLWVTKWNRATHQSRVTHLGTVTLLILYVYLI